MNYSFSEIRKAALAFVVSGLALAGYFLEIDAGTTEDVVAVAAAVLNTIGVFAVRNESAPTSEA